MTHEKKTGKPMISEQTVQDLKEIAGRENVSTEAADRITHAYDATGKKHLPGVVVFAGSTETVQGVVKLANDTRIPVFPRGAGSGFSGGSLPVYGGIALVMCGMDRIIEIDTDNLTATVEPGVVTAVLQQSVEKLGLFYPPDPASKAFCTLGGNVAENAGGPRCIKYGVTREYILGLEVVTPTGDIIHTCGKTLKNLVGYDLTKLFVGSEGTLGIVTRIILKLLPKPAAKKTMLVQFSSIESAAEAVSTIIKARIIPTTLEFMDEASIECVRGKSTIKIRKACRAILIIEIDGDLETLDPQAEHILKLIETHDVLDTRKAATDKESEEIWQVRRIISPSLKKIAPDKFNEDIVVPRSEIPEMIRRLDALSRQFNIPIVSFGHAGDGNIHVNVMVDLKEPGMPETAKKVLDMIFQETISLQGSISGEHGVGTEKAAYLPLELSRPTIHYMQQIKKALDPNNILNPGKIFLKQNRV